MENKIGAQNCISNDIDMATESDDGRARYHSETRHKMYHLIAETAQKASPKTSVDLCLEEEDVWEKLGLTKNLGRCNCVL